LAVLPDSIRSAPREGVLCKPIEGSLTLQLDLAWREDDGSPVLRALLGRLERNRMFLDVPEGAI
jgi:hypothetical protein